MPHELCHLHRRENLKTRNSNVDFRVATAAVRDKNPQITYLASIHQTGLNPQVRAYL
jgi:hypothetical protein